MKHLADICIDQVENGFQIQIKTVGKGRLALLRSKNKDYIAENKEKLKVILQEFVDQLETMTH